MYHILTHPPASNYGGILQAYALQRALVGLDYDADIVDYTSRLQIAMRPKGGRARLFSLLKLISAILGIGKRPVPSPYVSWFHRSFKKRFMRLFPLNDSRSNLSRLCDKAAFIVGSDQVWRGQYARTIESLPFMFLDFATTEQRRNSIAYSASFGSDTWEGTPEETAECARLLREFKAVSVREHSGIQICREVFGVDAVQMPDPTLLLNKADYDLLIREWHTSSHSQPFLTTYLLDNNPEKQALTHRLSQSMRWETQALLHVAGAPKLIDRVPLSIPQWLRFIRDSECLLTDSFHGCVFAIIFNKPFICLGNAQRGTARFESLLGTFGLLERMVVNPDVEQILKLASTPIDWERVNSIHNSEQKRAFDFLKNYLKAD